MHKEICFNYETSTYEVMEGGRTTRGGEHHGARKHKIVITQNTCTCGVLILMRFLCSHMITTCHERGVNIEAPVWFPINLSLRALVHTWSPQFEPIIDEDQWEPYTSQVYVADCQRRRIRGIFSRPHRA